MPVISALTTEVPASTSDMVLNVGSTTRRANVGQIVGGIYTSQGQITYAASSRDSTFLNPPSSNAILSYSSGSSAPAWIIGSSGQLFTVSSAGVTTVLAAPSSGAILSYSTANGSIGPAWASVTSGGVLIGSAANVPSFLAPPTSGAVLTFSSGSSIPAWSIPTSGAILIASSISVPTWRAIGTSGQILQSTGGSPAWVTEPFGSTSGWRLRHDTTQNLSSGNAAFLNWNVEDFDTDAFHSTVTNSSLVTITVAGTYIFGVQLRWGSNSSGYRQILVSEGGTTSIVVHETPPVTGTLTAQLVTGLRRFATTGNTLSVRALQDGVSTLDVTTGVDFSPIFWGYRVGA